jgi:hypothetical protein
VTLKAARGFLGLAMVWAGPALFLLGLRRSVPRVEFIVAWVVLGPALLMLVGHWVTNDTPLSTAAGIERRRQRVETGTTSIADGCWLLATVLFATLTSLGLGTVILSIRSAHTDGPWSTGFVVELMQLAWPLSLTLGAWHRTRWGWKPERFSRANEPEVALVGKTAADVGFKLCIGLLVVICTAVAIQFIRSGTDLTYLFRSRD